MGQRERDICARFTHVKILRLETEDLVTVCRCSATAKLNYFGEKAALRSAAFLVVAGLVVAGSVQRLARNLRARLVAEVAGDSHRNEVICSVAPWHSSCSTI